MSTLNIEELRTELDALLESQGTVVTRAQCDDALKQLALVLPRADMEDHQIDDMLDLYHGLLSQYGVTAAMLSTACERVVMAPRRDGKRFFPDPGELFQHCRFDVADRKAALAALELARRIVGARPVDNCPSGPISPRTDAMVTVKGPLGDALRSFARKIDGLREA